jgi:hypothetical protein
LGVAWLGHEVETVAEGSGLGFPVPMLKKWIDKIGFGIFAEREEARNQKRRIRRAVKHIISAAGTTAIAQAPHAD